MKLTICLFVCLTAFAADAPKPVVPDPLKDMRGDIAIAQRDFIMARADLQAAQEKLNTAQSAMVKKYDEGGAACKTVGKIFDPNTVRCIDAPSVPADKK